MATFDEHSDYLLAIALQAEFENEMPQFNHPYTTKKTSPDKRFGSPIMVGSGEYNVSPAKLRKVETDSLIDPQWEIVDPTPNIHSLFMTFNKRFFWGRLDAVEVRWSNRMYSCAGVCAFYKNSGLCSVRLSEPLLKLRPRKDLVQTLLHEMIHAYLFVTKNNRDRDGHGPEFKKHMFRINNAAGTSISIYHNFHEEVQLYQTHWWRCDGPCKDRPPLFGMVKRSMNRAPGPNDFWWTTHQANCGGKYQKIREPSKDKCSSKNKVVSKSGKTIKDFYTPSSSAKNNSKNNIIDSTNLKSNNFNSNGAIKRIPGFGKTGITQNSNNNASSFSSIVSFSDLTNINKTTNNHNNSSSNNIFKGKGKKLGSITKISTGGGNASMNRGTGTLVVNSKNNNSNKLKNNIIASSTVVSPPKQTTPLPLLRTNGNSVIFKGTGHRLGSGTSNSNSKPISRLVKDNTNNNNSKKPNCNSNNNLDKSNNVNTMSPEKYKDLFLKNDTDLITNNKLDEIDNDVLLFKVLPKSTDNNNVIDLTQSPRTNKNVTNEISQTSPEKIKDAFLNDSIETLSDNELADIDEDDILLSNIPLDDSSGDDEVKCPVCNMKIIRDDMCIHLQSCDLLNSSVQNMNNSGILEVGDDDDYNDNDKVSDENNKSNSERLKNVTNMIPCPCCTKLVNESKINSHLDECLSQVVINELVNEWR